jgi:hypothetical protein
LPERDGGTLINGTVTLTAIDNPIVIVRGESVKARFAVASLATNTPPIALSFASLPQGVTATTTTWTGSSTSVVTLELTADADAPQAQLPAEIRGMVDGSAVATLAVELDVSSVEGSLDPAFGNGGRISLPSGNGAPLGMATIGSDLVIVGWSTGGHAYVGHIGAGGTPITFKTVDGNATTVSAVAFSPDGRIAIATGNSAVITDAFGAVVSTMALPILPTAMAWDGDALIVSQSTSLGYALGTQKTTTTPITIVALARVAPGVVLVGGAMPPAAVGKYDVSTLAVGADLSYGQNGLFASQMGNIITGFSTDTSGGALAAFGGTAEIGLMRLTPQGTLDATFGSNGVASVFTNANVYPGLVVGTNNVFVFASETQTVSPASVGRVTRFSTDGKVDGSFGVFGTSRIVLDTAVTITAASLDPSGSHLCITGSMAGSTTALGYLACLR